MKCESVSKLHNPEVIPDNLTMLAPVEEISMDFAIYGSRKFLVIKDKATWLIDVTETCYQTTPEAMKATRALVYNYGLPHCVHSDNGPAFRQGFTDILSGLDVKRTLSSAFNPSSNDQPERGVQQLRDAYQFQFLYI